MTPEEEQKLRNFRLLGGGSSMELPQQQQQPTAPLLGQGVGKPAVRPEATGDIDPSRLGTPTAQSSYNPFGIDTSVGLGGPIEEVIMNPENWQSRGERAKAESSAPPNMPQTSAFQAQAAPPLISEGIGQIGGVAPMSQEQGALANPMARPQVPSEQQAEAGSPQANFQNRMATGEPLTFTEMGAAQDFAARLGLQFNPETGYSRRQGIDLGSIERQSATAQEADPVRATFPLPNGEVVMERESGERFNPTADQLQSFNSTMQAVSQPTATGMGVGGDEGVVFGGGQAPMSAGETQAMLQERFGAPTISAIQSLPAGQGSGMQTDAQGRMIDPNVDRSEFEQASAEREARLAARPDFNEPQASQNVPRDVREAAANPRPTPQQQARLATWENSTQGQQMGGVQGLAGTEGQGSAQDEVNLMKGLADLEIKGLEADKLRGQLAAMPREQKEKLMASQAELENFQGQINKLTGVRDEIAKITGNNTFTEGGLGWLNSKLPLGSDARTVARLAKEIEGSTFIRGIIDSKNRGATFGPLSDLEGRNITAAYGKILEPDMANDDRVRAINYLLTTLNEGIEGAKKRHAAKFNQSGDGGQQSQPAPQQGNVPNVEGVTIKRIN